MFEIIWILTSLTLMTAIVLLARHWGSAVITSLVAVSIIMANIFATKMIKMFGFTVPAGIVVYSISFMLTDVLSEFYGKVKAIRAVWLGFLCNILFIFFVAIILNWSSAFEDETMFAFQKVFSLSFRVSIAALIAYLISQFHDVFAYEFWGKKTKGKYLWIRNNASTFISQTLDTIIFTSISFLGVLPIFPLIIGQLILKIIIALLDTFFIYFLKGFIFKSAEYKIFE